MFLTHGKCTINNNFYYFKVIIIPQNLVHMQGGKTICEISGSQNFRPTRSLRMSKPSLGFHRRCTEKAVVLSEHSLESW